MIILWVHTNYQSPIFSIRDLRRKLQCLNWFGIVYVLKTSNLEEESGYSNLPLKYAL